MRLLLITTLSLASGQADPSGCDATRELTVRNAHAMAYHEGEAAVMLFGGADERQVLADLWAWNGEQWLCLAEDGPPPRTFPALAYDGVSDRLILFGGNRVLFGTARDAATFLDDMWAWNGHAWHRMKVSTPPARAEAGIAYDSRRRRVVLFGGHSTENGERVRFGDTWEWDGIRWELKSSDGPAPRNGAAMAYDAGRKRIVLFGGSGAPGETWEWDGQVWTEIPAATEGRFNSAMAFDDARNAVIRFGGWTEGGRVGDTWRYDGVRWTRLTRDGPVARNHTAMAYDRSRRVIVLFGGHDGDRVFGDTWEWTGNAWSQSSGHAPRPRIAD